MGKLDDMLCVVTGGARGIGRAICTAFLAEGARVVLTDIDEDEGRKAAAGLGCSFHRLDVASEAEWDALAAAFPAIDVLVNNAGITRDGLMLRMTDEDFDEVLNVNLRSIFIACRAAARPMMRGRFGRMINISSVTGLIGNPGQANYAAAKAGIIGMTKTIAKEFASKGVTANVVAPGFIETEMTEALGSAVLEEAAKRIPLKRLGQGDDIAHAVSYLASEGAGYVTGQVLTVDGGMVC